MYDRRARASSTPPALLQCAPSRQGKRAPCQDSGSAQRVSSLGVHHHWNWQTTAHDEELDLGDAASTDGGETASTGDASSVAGDLE
ncbi:unnamed protein product [Prorocentrum cordatum]|uniref:Uncharacterized protein n=1 Tax=Prorocentrum cordatum TaxID=2364126 RepID=A0ABN9RN76_9DINO|nr:unnamed protein product [Polarella glacialis]